MGLAVVINDESQFQSEMTNAGTKLVVVDFTATWCPPCQRMAPFFDQLPARFPAARFLKVDVDKCADTAAAQGISAMPTFIFYRKKTKIDQLQGADPTALENKVRQHYGTGEEGEEDDAVSGHLSSSRSNKTTKCWCFTTLLKIFLKLQLRKGRTPIAVELDSADGSVKEDHSDSFIWLREFPRHSQSTKSLDSSTNSFEVAGEQVCKCPGPICPHTKQERTDDAFENVSIPKIRQQPTAVFDDEKEITSEYQFYKRLYEIAYDKPMPDYREDEPSASNRPRKSVGFVSSKDVRLSEDSLHDDDVSKTD